MSLAADLRLLAAPAIAGAALLLAAPAHAEEADTLLRAHSSAPYHHHINLYDEDGRIINPAERDPGVMSIEKTCGLCHDYTAISRGFHWNARLDDAEHGRPGEPWIIADERTGTQIPVSYRGWPGMFTPDQLGWTTDDMIAEFGRHMPGGWTRPASEARDPVPPFGKLEVDCFACHAVNQPIDRSVWTEQIQRKNYKWASLAAGHLARVRGTAADLPDDWDPLFPPIGMDHLEEPRVDYDQRRFDSENKVHFDFARGGNDANCYTCHSHRPVGEGAPERFMWEVDVHLASGMNCTDCHSNSINHHIIRGYEGERHPSHAAFAATMTCAGCHYGVGTESPAAASLRPEHALGGRHGAPIPGHAGIPPIHFETMSCTSCHSGPLPAERNRFAQTSMSHGLGLSSKTRTQTRLPDILEPVLLRDDLTGKIAPYRVLYPAFWAWEQDGTLSPLAPARVLEAARTALPAAGTALTVDAVAAVLGAMEQRAPEGARAVFVGNGKLHRASGDGLAVEDHDRAAPVAWAIGHNVRPAAQSWGSRGCMECHSTDSAMLTGTLHARHLAELGTFAVSTLVEGMELDEGYHRAFAQAFRMRTPFKVGGFAALGLIGFALLMQAGRFAAPAGRKP